MHGLCVMEMHVVINDYQPSISFSGHLPWLRGEAGNSPGIGRSCDLKIPSFRGYLESA